MDGGIIRLRTANRRMATLKPTQCFLFFFHRTFFKTIFERQPTHSKHICIFSNAQADPKNAKELALAHAPKPTHHPKQYEWISREKRVDNDIKF